jgi:hypothetical protein
MQTKLFFKLGIFGLAILGWMGCTETIEEPRPIDFNYSYFPIKLGAEYIYQSDSIVYNNGGLNIDTFSSQIREVVQDSFLNIDGEIEYTLARYYRRIATQEWTPINRWSIGRNAEFATRTEENLKFVKMIFPPKLGLRWNGNRFFDDNQKIEVAGELVKIYNDWTSKIFKTDVEITANDKKYSAIEIEVVDLNSLIERRLVKEWYAKDVGFLRRESIILDSDTSKPNEPWDKRAQKGYIHTYQLLSYK